MHSFFFWDSFFLCGPFLKSLLNLLQYCFQFMFWFFGYKASYSWTRDWNCNPCFGRWRPNHWTTHPWRFFFSDIFLHKPKCCDHCLLFPWQRSNHSCVGTWRLRPIVPYITTPHSSRIVLTVSVYYDKYAVIAYNWAKQGTIALHSSVLFWVPPVNGNPLQCSCLENPRDGRAWWAAVYGVAESQIRLKRLSSSSSISHCWQGCWGRWFWNFLFPYFWAGSSLLWISMSSFLALYFLVYTCN